MIILDRNSSEYKKYQYYMEILEEFEDTREHLIEKDAFGFAALNRVRKFDQLNEKDSKLIVFDKSDFVPSCQNLDLTVIQNLPNGEYTTIMCNSSLQSITISHFSILGASGDGGRDIELQSAEVINWRGGDPQFKNEYFDIPQKVVVNEEGVRFVSDDAFASEANKWLHEEGENRTLYEDCELAYSSSTALHQACFMHFEDAQAA